MEPIKIRWETGHMEINPDVFFPTSTAKRRITALRACIQEQPKKARALGYRDRLQEEQEALKKLKTQQSTALAAFKKKQKEFEAAEGVAKRLKQNAEVLRS